MADLKHFDNSSSIDLKQESMQGLLSPASESTLSEGHLEPFDLRLRDRHHVRRRRIHIAHIALLYTANIITAVILIWMRFRRPSDPSQAAFSPANPMVWYKETTFTSGVDDQISPFQGPPTPERNRLWRDQYHRGLVTRATPEEASQFLINGTYVLPSGESAIQLEVFHQLHCLNSVRRLVYPEVFPEYSLFLDNGEKNEVTVTHMDHCLDRLRQGIMCASNVGVQSWKKMAGVPDFEGAGFEEWITLDMGHVTTTCRNFEAVRDWAFSRELKGTQNRDHGQLGLKLPE